MKLRAKSAREREVLSQDVASECMAVLYFLALEADASERVNDGRFFPSPVQLYEASLDLARRVAYRRATTLREVS
jgi:hypothetical protein